MSVITIKVFRDILLLLIIPDMFISALYSSLNQTKYALKCQNFTSNSTPKTTFSTLYGEKVIQMV